MENTITVGTKKDGYMIDLEEKSLTINFFNSFYENVFQKKEKHIKIPFLDIKHIDITYTTSDKTIWGINSELVLVVYLTSGKKYFMHGNIDASNQDFLEAYEALKNEGIVFIDKYNIINHLYNNDSKRIDYILVELIKKKVLPMS